VRRTTRDKWYGRILASQALQAAGINLAEAIKLADSPTPFTQKLDLVILQLRAAREHIAGRNMGHKRLLKRLETEQTHIIALLEDIKHIPLFPEEKAIAKVAQAKNNDLAAGKTVSKPTKYIPKNIPVSKKTKAKKKKPVKKSVKKKAPKVKKGARKHGKNR
jgi:hypothetical protein